MRRFAGFLGGLGLIMMIFGLIGAVFFVGPLRAIGVGQLVAGTIGLAIYLIYHLSETMQVIVRRRNDIFGILGGIIFLGLLIGLNVIAQSKFSQKNWDMTVNRVHSLAPESIELAKTLPDKIHVFAFLESGSPKGERMRHSLKKYSAYTDKILLTFHDTNEEPVLVKQLEAAAGEVILQRESNKRTIKLINPSEEAITNAMKKVLRSEDKKIYFLEGAGQADLNRQDDEAGLFIAKFKLEAEGFKVEPLNLAQTKKIPADAKVVVSWGARRVLTDAESQLISHYLARGGQFVLAHDPSPTVTKDRMTTTGLESVIAQYGLEIKPAMGVNILDAGNGPQASWNIIGLTYSTQPIVGKFTQKDITVFPLASPVVRNVSYKGKATTTPLVSSAPDSWGEIDIKALFAGGRATKSGNDITGPFAIAQISEWTVEKAAPGDWGTNGKLVVFGNASFATNRVNQTAANSDLFANTFSYLIGDNISPLSIKPRTFSPSTLKLSETEKRGVYYASLFIIPELLMLLGVLAAILRRARI